MRNCWDEWSLFYRSTQGRLPDKWAQDDKKKKGIPGRGDSKSKDHEPGIGLVCSQNSHQALYLQQGGQEEKRLE